jgi:hypothetical protein
MKDAAGETAEPCSARGAVPEPVASSSRKRASVSASAATRPTTSSVGVAVHQFESVGDQRLGDTADVGAADVDDERGPVQVGAPSSMA